MMTRCNFRATSQSVARSGGERPEFNAKIGAFQNQKLVHINFARQVFPTSEEKKPEDKGTL